MASVMACAPWSVPRRHITTSETTSPRTNPVWERRGSHSNSPLECRPTGKSSRLREQQSESRAVTGSRLHFDLAIMKLNDAKHHRQTDAAALFFRREIQVEDPPEMLWWNADASVLHRHLDPMARHRTARHTQRPAVRHRLARVYRQIEQRLLKHTGIGVDFGHAGGAFRFDDDPAPLGFGSRHRRDFADEGCQMYGLQL